MSGVEKVVPVLLRDRHGRREILAFRHPQAGLQIVKGTVEPGETAIDAALRELAEESGIGNARIVQALGASVAIAEGERWSFFLCTAPEQPARWIFTTTDDGGLIFSFFWQPLDEAAGEDWHPTFRAALAYIRTVLGAVS